MDDLLQPETFVWWNSWSCRISEGSFPADIFPLKTKKFHLKMDGLEDAFSCWNSPFLGDSVSFRGCNFLGVLLKNFFVGMFFKVLHMQCAIFPVFLQSPRIQGYKSYSYFPIGWFGLFWNSGGQDKHVLLLTKNIQYWKKKDGHTRLFTRVLFSSCRTRSPCAPSMEHIPIIFNMLILFGELAW